MWELFPGFTELSSNSYVHTSRLFSPCMRLTVSLPAVSPDWEGCDSIAGDPGGSGCDLHLDTPCTLLVVALQCCATQWRFDGITHLRSTSTNTVNYFNNLKFQGAEVFHPQLLYEIWNVWNISFGKPPKLQYISIFSFAYWALLWRKKKKKWK